MSTAPATVTVIGGVDTHKHTHYAAVIDEHGRLLGHQQFPATDRRLPGAADLDAQRTGTVARDRRGKHRLVRRDPDPVADRCG